MSDELTWFKSSYSDGEGSNCVEVALDWRKSTYSDDEGANCVEVALGGPDAVHIRDSKRAAGPHLNVSAPAWKAFISAGRPGA
ncbi:DUF397 domain-containing protein [Streptomyces alboflavus]|uniref:DUF397 domain-containing protein n=1 Tax=Streptomyces alboflavus TaxID=67267 RepID=UPI0004C0B4CB|nr:DUF397 domain-containing protein [Streptomyces alboflavus]